MYKHYAKTGFGGADMAIAARYYGLSLQARGRKRAGITRDQSWAWRISTTVEVASHKTY